MSLPESLAPRWVGARLRLARVAAIVLVLMVALLESGKAAEHADAHESAYSGSLVCKQCHDAVYRNWQTTRHSYSVLSGDEARQAGYPLPTASAETSATRSWPASFDEIAYVIGGRKRIAYVDLNGQTLGTSFHHRIGGWDAFPQRAMRQCGSCHITGFGEGPEHPDNAILPGRWVEMNIGCESCHGPGARHIETLEPTDIRSGPDSGVCGQCHSLVGKVLPKGEMHATHDMLQVWNQDRHVTGVAQHSHDTFCARCHAPYRAQSPALSAAPRPVYTENKRNITCIGCHDPHQLTSGAYQRDRVSLSTPTTSRLHTFEGDDGDLERPNYKEWSTVTQSCRSCHRGADRIELDHANAQCEDCHNTFKHNHGVQTRQTHDSNHPRLSCRGCHDDADHLMTIVFADPDFIEPKTIHNLRTLPAAVRDKYGFDYPKLAHGPAQLGPADTSYGARSEARPVSAKSPPVAPPQRSTGTAGEAADALVPMLARAVAYAEQGQHQPAIQAVNAAMQLDSGRLLVDLLHGARFRATRVVLQQLDPLLATPGFEPSSAQGVWLRSVMATLGASTDDLDSLLKSAPADARTPMSTQVVLALLALKHEQMPEALEILTVAKSAHPDAQLPRVAMAIVQMSQGRFGPARSELSQVLNDRPNDTGARYLLGVANLGSGDLAAAEQQLRPLVDTGTDLLPAWFDLARVYRLAGQFQAAAKVYENLLQRDPELFEARYKLAVLMKLMSDRIAFELAGRREQMRPAAMGESSWDRRLEQWEQQSKKFADLALAQLGLALQHAPGSAAAVLQIAEIYRRTNRFAEALSVYEWLSERQPRVWMHRYRRGTILLQMGDAAKAAEILQSVIETAPMDGDSYVALGLAHVRLTALDHAVQVFEKGVVHAPFNPALYTNLGAALASRGQFQQARRALERALELESFPLPRVHITYTNLALLHARKGRFAHARQALNAALHAYPDYAYAQTLRTQDDQALAARPFVYNDMLERFGEVTTVAFDNE